jgi:preprotein translocase subunit SecG
MSKKKKVIISICSIVSIIVLVLCIFIYIEHKVKVDTISMIGGVDGLTSTIIAEKVGNNTLFIVVGILAIVLLSVTFALSRKCDLFKQQGR